MMINQDKKIEPEVFQKSGAGASQNRSFVIRFAEPVEDDLFKPEPNFEARTVSFLLCDKQTVSQKYFKKCFRISHFGSELKHPEPFKKGGLRSAVWQCIISDWV